MTGFLLIIIVSSIILFKRHRKVALVLLSLPIAMIVLLLGWWIYEVNYHFVKSTDLSEEYVGGIELNQSLASYQELNSQIGFLEGENVDYPMYLTSPSLVIGADENDEIMFVSSSLVEYETSRGIKVNDNKKMLIQTYGDNYYKGREMGMGGYLVYVDRNARKMLCFWLEDGQVKEIEFKKI